MAFSKNKLISIALTIVLLVFLASCESKEPDVPVEPPKAKTFINIMPIPEAPDESTFRIDTGFSEKSREKHKLNEDSIGWIHLPNTSISDVVMFYPHKEEKFFYLKKNFEKKYSFDGSYFIDFRSHMDGGRDGMSQNVVVYGHSMSDDPNKPLFSQLKKYWDESYAKENPYIYFSDLEEDMAFEIFAVFITDTKFKYNRPNPTPEEFKDIIATSKELSMYNYDLDIKEDDKILTLSTCLYVIDGVNYGYQNRFRYVVMAKLLNANEKLKDEVSLTVNPTATVSK